MEEDTLESIYQFSDEVEQLAGEVGIDNDIHLDDPTREKGEFYIQLENEVGIEGTIDYEENLGTVESVQLRNNDSRLELVHGRLNISNQEDRNEIYDMIQGNYDWI